MVEPEADMLSIASCKTLSFVSLSVFSCLINFCKLASAFSLVEDSAGIKFVLISFIAVVLAAGTIRAYHGGLIEFYTNGSISLTY